MCVMIHTDKIIRGRGLEKGGRVQKIVDSEVLRYCDSLTPYKDGDLKKSGIIGTKKGSGIVRYTAKYAKRQYYENAGFGTQGVNRGGQRGRLWFKRMKEMYKQAILDKAKKELCRKK